jgi:transmembrane sensor
MNHERNLSQDEIEERAIDEYVRQHPVDCAAAAWHLRKTEGFVSHEEEGEFAAWLAASPAHEAAFREIERSHEDLRGFSPAQRAQLHAMCEGLTDVAETKPALALPRVIFRWPGLSRPWRFAAALCVCAVFLAIGWYDMAQPRFERHYASVRGGQLSASLPDGSALLLDSLTQADVRFYRDRREVRLQTGQGFFTVATDAERPFEVLAGKARVRVIGTRFSVRHIPGAAPPVGVAVQVGAGRVEVSGWVNGERVDAVELVAGQGVTVSPEGMPGAVVQLVPEDIAPWRAGRFVFEDVLLSDALAEFERYGPIGLVVRDPEVARLRVGGSFQVRRLDLFARALPNFLPVRLEMRGNVTEIVKDGG